MRALFFGEKPVEQTVAQAPRRETDFLQTVIHTRRLQNRILEMLKNKLKPNGPDCKNAACKLQVLEGEPWSQRN